MGQTLKSSRVPTRRSLLRLIGMVAGSNVMYQAMTQLGMAEESRYAGPPKLTPPPKRTSVLVLGAGIAGMVAAIELRDAGYDVQVLEFNNRAGGRNWSLYGGDTYVELGGAVQHVQFDQGQYLNPGPWRIPHHHYGILHYVRRLKVPLEPFIQVNYNAFLHSTDAFNGKPKRYREVQADFHGHVAELLAKTTKQNALDTDLTTEDLERLFEALRAWGALDGNNRYVKGPESSTRRGPKVDAGGGLQSLPIYSAPEPLPALLESELWRAIGWGQDFLYQMPMFQPRGGMGQIGRAFGAELGNIIKYNCKVTEIHQDNSGVTVTYICGRNNRAPSQAHADWCVCTIPASILSQIPMNVGSKMRAAIDQLPYRASLKTGLQFKRRFWEEDDGIFGGITYTNQPNAMIGYPAWDYFSQGKGVLLGTYVMDEPAFIAAAKSPQQRIEDALAYGEKIHPQYRKEFECGVAVAWHRVPWTLGCSAVWTEEARAAHYDNLCALDGRIVLAGEHASRLPDWQEGSVTSATDAIIRLHARVMSSP